MVDYSETIEVYGVKSGVYSKLTEYTVKVILWPLSKVTRNETGSQVNDTWT